MKENQAMNDISVANLITNGFSQADAEKIAPVIKEALSKNEPIELDFSGVQFFTTLFFSTALTYLIGELGKTEYERLITIKNLSESGQETYSHALDYAIKYFNMTSEEREAERAIINDETGNN